MPLPSSGPISTAQIRAEIGGSGPVTFPSTETDTGAGGATTNSNNVEVTLSDPF